MRRAILLALCALTLALVASVPSGAAPAAAPKVRSSAQWFPASRTLYVMASWTPVKYQTDVTAIVSAGGKRIRTLHAKRWLIGHKTFALQLPRTLGDGTEVVVKLRVASRGQRTARSHALTLR